MNQRGNHADRRRDVISTYINVESTLSVCWAVQADNSIELETSTKASKVIGSCTSELISLNNSNSSSKEPSSSSSQRDSLDAKTRCTEMKSQSPDKLILSHLNINSIRNKFDGLKFVIYNKIDIFLISKTKLDDSFPTVQFFIEGFAIPYRHDRSSKGGGLLLYIREDIPSKRLSCKTNYDTVTLIVEINLKKRKWFLNGSYNPNKNQISHHLECLNRILDEYNIFR